MILYTTLINASLTIDALFDSFSIFVTLFNKITIIINTPVSLTHVNVLTLRNFMQILKNSTYLVVNITWSSNRQFGEQRVFGFKESWIWMGWKNSVQIHVYMCLIGIESRHSLTCILVYLDMDKPVDKTWFGLQKSI